MDAWVANVSGVVAAILKRGLAGEELPLAWRETGGCS